VTAPDDLHVVTVPQTDERLGRQVVHDPRSRNFAFRSVETPRRDIQLRVYGPRSRPDQAVGCCTGVDQCVKANTAGNRVKGVVLRMDDALKIYSRATEIDPWPGSWEPDDTGSSGLAACKAAVEQGLITCFDWIFTGTAGIYAALEQGRPVGVGTWWMDSMFDVDQGTGLIDVDGRRAGGHQYTVVGYSRRYDAFRIECWWGSWGFRNTGRALIRRADLDALLADDGDAHVVTRRMPP
jgi:hypothetical protein